MEETMTVDEARKVLRVHAQTVRGWVHDGTLPAQRQTRHRAFRIDAKAVHRLKEKREQLVPVAVGEKPKQRAGRKQQRARSEAK